MPQWLHTARPGSWPPVADGGSATDEGSAVGSTLRTDSPVPCRKAMPEGDPPCHSVGATRWRTASVTEGRPVGRHAGGREIVRDYDTARDRRARREPNHAYAGGADLGHLIGGQHRPAGRIGADLDDRVLDGPRSAARTHVNPSLSQRGDHGQVVVTGSPEEAGGQPCDIDDFITGGR